MIDTDTALAMLGFELRTRADITGSPFQTLERSDGFAPTHITVDCRTIAHMIAEAGGALDRLPMSDIVPRTLWETRSDVVRSIIEVSCPTPNLARVRQAVDDLRKTALQDAADYRDAGHTQKFAEGRADMARVVLAIIDKELNP